MHYINKQALQSAFIEVEDVLENPDSPAFFPTIVEPVIEWVESAVEKLEHDQTLPAGALTIFTAFRSLPASTDKRIDPIEIISNGKRFCEALREACNRRPLFRSYDRRFVRATFESLLQRA